MSSNLAAILLFSVCVFQSFKVTYQEQTRSSPAEDEGKVIVRIWYMTAEEFASSEEIFKDVTADIASQYCRKARNNCRAEVKYIRPNDVIVVARVADDEHVQIHVYIRDIADENKAALTDNQLANVYRHHDDDFVQGFGKPVTVISPQEEHWEAWRIAVVTVSACLGALALLGAAVIVKNAVTNDQKGTGTHTPDDISKHLQLYESVKEKRGDTVTSYENLAFTGDEQKRPQNGSVVYDNVGTNSEDSPAQRSSHTYEQLTVHADVRVPPQRDVTKEPTTADAEGVYIEMIAEDDQGPHVQEKTGDTEDDENGDITYF